MYRLLHHRHFWRIVDFDQLGEMYVSNLIRSLAISITGIFVPLYMLKLGYSLTAVMVLLIWFYVGRAFIFDPLSGFLTARFGPKHTIIMSYGMLIISTSLFLTLPNVGWPLWLVGMIWGGCNSLFCIPFDVDFSKVKHKEHGGKELGYASVLEKAGGIIGPLVGGIVASLFGGQYIFLTAIVMLILGGWPLLRSAEPTLTRQPFAIKFSLVRRIKRDIIAFSGYHCELLTGTLWPIYLTLFVFTSSLAYAQLGFLASLSVAAASLTVILIGKLVDRRRGRTLLRFGVVGTAITHLVKPLVVFYPIAIVINVVEEIMTAAFHIPFTKGMYDAVDDVAEDRVSYFTVMEMSGSILKGVLWGILAILSTMYSAYIVLTVGFIIAALGSLIVMSEKFEALRGGKL